MDDIVMLTRRIESCYLIYYVVVVVYVFLFLGANIIALWWCSVWSFIMF